MIKIDNTVLYKQAQLVDFDDPDLLLAIANGLTRVMILKNGIGIAAPQCGISKRIFIMKMGNINESFFNPEISNFSDVTVDMDEGCLSFPRETINITRPSEIDVIYNDHLGERFTCHLIGIQARCFQHELDHLNGITFTMKHDNLYNEAP